MKKLILVLPFILMACGHEESKLEKEYRLAKEASEKANAELEQAMGKEEKEKWEAENKEASKALIKKADSLEALKKH